jgi:branched-chain amino acid transport system permease protein
MIGRHRKPAAALIVGLSIAATAPLFASTYFIGVALDLLMWIALAESWILLSGMTGYISLGHAVFFGVGGYVMALSWGLLPLWLIVPLAGLVAGLLLASAIPACACAGPISSSSALASPNSSSSSWSASRPAWARRGG